MHLHFCANWEISINWKCHRSVWGSLSFYRSCIKTSVNIWRINFVDITIRLFEIGNSASETLLAACLLSCQFSLDFSEFKLIFCLLFGLKFQVVWKSNLCKCLFDFVSCIFHVLICVLNIFAFIVCLAQKRREIFLEKNLNFILFSATFLVWFKLTALKL